MPNPGRREWILCGYAFERPIDVGLACDPARGSARDVRAGLVFELDGEAAVLAITSVSPELWGTISSMLAVVRGAGSDCAKVTGGRGDKLLTRNFLGARRSPHCDANSRGWSFFHEICFVGDQCKFGAFKHAIEVRIDELQAANIDCR